jgi:ABC-type branched-subunit amino acid transport system ATPase component
MDIVFSFASRVIVMVAGGVLLEAEPAVVSQDPRVREVYLGTKHTTNATGHHA